MTAAINDGEEATPPRRVTRETLVSCIILAARLNHRPDLDEASARQLIRHVETALASADNTLDSRRAFACRTDGGQLEEIVLFSDYHIDWETWELTRVEQSLWGDPPVWVHAGSLEVSWYKFELAVTQALREARLLPVADAVPPSELEAQLTTSEQARAKAEADAETLRQDLLIAQIARAEAEADVAELRTPTPTRSEAAATDRPAEPEPAPSAPESVGRAIDVQVLVKSMRAENVHARREDLIDAICRRFKCTLREAESLYGEVPKDLLIGKGGVGPAKQKVIEAGREVLENWAKNPANFLGEA